MQAVIAEDVRHLADARCGGEVVETHPRRVDARHLEALGDAVEANDLVLVHVFERVEDLFEDQLPIGLALIKGLRMTRQLARSRVVDHEERLCRGWVPITVKVQFDDVLGRVAKLAHDLDLVLHLLRPLTLSLIHI